MADILYTFPDLSAYQGNVNFAKLKTASKYAILRAGYGKNNIDQKYQQYATSCKDNDIIFGIYWFSYAYTSQMAEKEADYAIEAYSKYATEGPIAFDLEYDTVRYARTKGVAITKKLATEMAVCFLSKVATKGYTPILYTNRDYRLNYFDIATIRNKVPGLKIWYAYYNSTLAEADKEYADVWQYTSKGAIAGVSGNVDMNKAYVNIFGKKATTSVSKTTSNVNIADFQSAANADGYRDMYGNKLEVDGKCGNKTKYVLNNVKLSAKQALISWKAGSTGSLVKYWQRRLNEIIGANLEVDGRYGPAVRKATIQYQTKFNLTVNGIADYSTIYSSFFH